MKLFWRFLFGVVLGVFLFFPNRVFAQSSTEAVVPEISEEDSTPVSTAPVFIADKQVVLSDTYTGMVFVAGGQVEVSGQVAGDLLVAGGSVTIDGVINQDVYAGGGTVIISGQVFGNVVVAGGEIVMTPTAQVAGSVIAAGESISLAGETHQQSFAFGRVVNFLGTFHDGVHVMAEKVFVTEGALIEGFMTGETAEEVMVADSAQVTEGVAVEIVEHPRQQSRASLSVWLGKLAITAVSFVLVMSIFTWLFGKKLSAVSLKAIEEWQSSLVTGMVLYMAFGLGSLLLLLTVLGLKAGVIFLLVACGLAAIGWIVPAYFLGQWIFPDKNHYLQSAFGAVMVAVVVSLPLIGWVFGVFLTVFGAGAIFRTLRK